ncbi:alcohol dehydrogenase catalytic domain-containing protein [Chloroflexia bacterium SDU3-3]|nr:alcohol dehydrogenase catalytic domain-containing protein [Chloroflexia bacterium SDU3-3]
MRALVFDGQLHLDRNYPEPSLQRGEALIRPRLVGICNTDIEITRGYMGFHGVLGHEFVGEVIACEESFWVGKRVVGEINAACLRCPTCLRGDPTHCPQRTTLGIGGRDGVMAERFSLPIACLHEVPAALPDTAAVFTEPLAAAFEILEHAHIRPTERVAVVGDGKLGLLCAMALRLTGAELVMLGRHPERWGLLRELGVAAMPSASATDRASGALRPRSFDLVVDATGNASGLATALRLVRPRGRLVLKSTYHGDSPINLSAVVVDELQLLGSRCGPFAPALRAMASGLIPTEPLVADRFLLEDGLKGFQAAHGKLKVLLEV